MAEVLEFVGGVAFFFALIQLHRIWKSRRGR